jgi:hypothetical protein
MHLIPMHYIKVSNKGQQFFDDILNTGNMLLNSRIS